MNMQEVIMSVAAEANAVAPKEKRFDKDFEDYISYILVSESFEELDPWVDSACNLLIIYMVGGRSVLKGCVRCMRNCGSMYRS